MTAPADKLDTGTAPANWQCVKCGNLIYLGLVHYCPTAPNLPYVKRYSDNG